MQQLSIPFLFTLESAWLHSALSTGANVALKYNSAGIRLRLRWHTILAETDSDIHVLYTRVYVGDQFKTWTVLKPSDGFKTGSKRARRLRNGPDGFETGATALQLVQIIADGFKAGRNGSLLTLYV